MILNPFLKELFQVPPAPAAKPGGWSFPSGHMLTSATLWMWLAWEYKNKIFYAFVALLLAAIGFSLVYCDYHYPVDIAGALFFSLILLFLYNLTLKLPVLQKNPPLIGYLLAIFAIPFILFIPNVLTRPNIWIAFGALLGFASGWLINNKFFSRSTTMPFYIKLFTLALSILGLIAIQYLFGQIQTKSFLITTAQFFTIAFWLSSIPQGITCLLFRNAPSK